MMTEELKKCSKCGEWKTRDQFSRKRNNKSDGLRAHCKACEKAYRLLNIERRREYDRVRYATNAKSILAQKRVYGLQNRARISIAKRNYYLAHAEEKRLYAREHRAAHADYYVIYAREYRARNPHLIKAARSLRIARLRSLPHTLTPAHWQAALTYFGGCCAVCGRPPGLWHTLAADHWVPVTKCGGTTPDNIVPLCHGVGGCNNSKKDRDALEWLVSTYGPRKGRAIHQRIQDWLNGRKEENE